MELQTIKPNYGPRLATIQEPKPISVNPPDWLFSNVDFPVTCTWTPFQNPAPNTLQWTLIQNTPHIMSETIS